VSALVIGADPAVLYLHGGNYVLGSAYGYRPLAAALATAADRGALVPDFRLAPEHPFPAALDDALAAYRWLAGQRGGASEVVLAGDSSGAGLALAVLLSLKAEGEPMPAGAALLCPNLDLSGAMLTPSTGPHLLDELVRMCQAYTAGHPLEDPRVSPLLGDLTGLPPLLIQYGRGDRARPEAEALARDARHAGVDVRVERYAADTHVFQMFWSFLPEAADAIGQAGGFLAGLLQASPASPRPSPRQI
jgi:epsilon-lactone hydrolase